MVLFKVALAVGSLQLALAYPSNSSNHKFNKRADPSFSDLHQPLFDSTQIAQLKQGFTDSCALAQAGLLFAEAGNPIYAKYFNTNESTLNNVQQVFSGIVDGQPAPDGTCSTELGRIIVSNDFINANNRNVLSCISDSTMASTRNGEDPNTDPVVVICPTLLAHGNIGPTVIPGAPSPFTCDTVEDGGQRITWRMDTIGSTILHEYTHIAFLVEKALPQGTKDSLDISDYPAIPDDVELLYYGPVDIQGDLRSRVGGVKSVVIADAYTYFANEAFWSQKCGITFGLSQEGD